MRPLRANDAAGSSPAELQPCRLLIRPSSRPATVSCANSAPLSPAPSSRPATVSCVNPCPRPQSGASPRPSRHGQSAASRSERMRESTGWGCLRLHIQETRVGNCSPNGRIDHLLTTPNSGLRTRPSQGGQTRPATAPAPPGPTHCPCPRAFPANSAATRWSAPLDRHTWSGRKISAGRGPSGGRALANSQTHCKPGPRAPRRPIVTCCRRD